MLPIFIDNHPGEALVDTGASNSVASRGLVKILEKNGHVFTTKEVNISFADGKSRRMKIREVNANVYLRGKCIQTKFVCLNNDDEGRTLLGVDFIEAANIITDVKAKRWSFAVDKSESYRFVMENCTTRIDAISESDDIKNRNDDVDIRSDEGSSLNIEQKDEFAKLLSDYEECFASKGNPCTMIEHSIDFSFY